MFEETNAYETSSLEYGAGASALTVGRRGPTPSARSPLAGGEPR